METGAATARGLLELYRVGFLLGDVLDDLVEVGSGAGEAFGHGVDIDLEGQRAAVFVAELGGEVGGGDAGCGEKRRGGVAQRVGVHGFGQAGVVDEGAEHGGDRVRPVGRAVGFADHEVLV